MKLAKNIRHKELLLAIFLSSITVVVIYCVLHYFPRTDIPGEMSLPFEKKVVYLNKDDGCRNYEAGWTLQHSCTKSSLLIYKPSGHLYEDEKIIAQQFVAQKRGYATASEVNYPVVPFSLGANAVNSGSEPIIDNGLCLLMIDKTTAPPQSIVSPACARPQDYSEVRAHWPASNANYAIAVIYTHAK